MTRQDKPAQDGDEIGVEAPELIRHLLRPDAWPHDTDRVDLIETHISWIVLTGRFAYKIKKPVELNFVDFSTLARRKRACFDELRLNRRLAPEIYLDVVPIGGTPGEPLVDKEPAIEYAVRMQQFAQDALLESRLEHGRLSEADMRQAARMIADFHRSLQGEKPPGEFGSAASIVEPFDETLDDLAEEVTARSAGLASRVRSLHRRFHPEFEARRAGGFVRECHGDLHLRNLIKLDGRIIAFDCLEFSAALRWIDVVNEAAFLFMDLEAHGARSLAYRFVNDYLQHTGDYAGLALLNYYAAYHALVRAKVAKLALGAGALDDPAIGEYIVLGSRLLSPSKALLVLTHGLSGSGKTTVTESLIGRLPAIRIRSDIERKRLAGLAPHAKTHAAFGEGIYDEAATRRTYRRLLSLAQPALRAGCNVIVDAAFLKRWQRALFQQAAGDLDVDTIILDVVAPEHVLRERVSQREAAGRAVSEATTEILDGQLAETEPLDEDERARSIPVRTDVRLDAGALAKRIIGGRLVCKLH